MFMKGIRCLGVLTKLRVDPQRRIQNPVKQNSFLDMFERILNMSLIEEVYKILFYIIYLLAKTYDSLRKIVLTWISYTHKVMHKTISTVFALLSFLFL